MVQKLSQHKVNIPLICTCVRVFFNGWSVPPHRDLWATAISQLSLRTVTRVDSVCQAQCKMLHDGVTWHVPILCLYWAAALTINKWHDMADKFSPA